MIVSVVNLKGGAGKTTTAFFLAACAAREGLDVVVVDADRESSGLSWADIAGGDLPFAVVAGQSGLASQVKQLRAEGKTVIVDGPPNERDSLWAASSIADVVLVPVAPTPIEINRLRSTIVALADVDAARPDGLNAHVFFTRFNPRTVLAGDASALMEELQLPVFKATVRNIEAYKHAFGTSPKYLLEYQEVWDELKDKLE